MIITLIGIIVSIIAILLLMYIFIGLVMTISLRKGIRKIWTETDGPRPRSFLWVYTVCITCWPRVDWDNVKFHDNWAISIEKGKHEEKF